MNFQHIKDWNDLTLLEFVSLLRNSWKTVAIFCAFGIFGSVTYILFAPKQFEATAQIRMAQIGQFNNYPNSQDKRFNNALGTFLEDPPSLVARMKLPSNYPSFVINACAYQDKPRPSQALSKDLRYVIPRGVTNMVELKVISPSSQIASTCIRAVVEQIQMMQAQLAEPLIKEAEIKLASDNERIDAARKVISRAQNGSISVAYLSVRDELAYYLADREKTIYFISSVKNRGATLMSPIYAPDEPVPSKKILILILGLLGGCFLGALTALTRPILAKFNNKLLGLK